MKKMILKLLAALLSILLTNPVHATAKPFAYSAEKDGKTIHLLGTMHINVSIEEIPCSNEILKILETNDFLLSEMSESYLTLIKLLGDNWQIIFTASKKEREKIVESLSEEERAVVSKILTDHDGLITTNLSNIFEETQFVDKKKEPFEDLNPQTRKFLINKGMSAHKNYIDYLHSILLEILYTFFDLNAVHKIQLDAEIAEMAFSKNIPIEPLDNESTMIEEGTKITKESKVLEIFLPNAYKEEREIDSNDINTLVTTLFEIKEALKEMIPVFRATYLSGNKESALQYINDLSKNGKAVEFFLKNRNELWFQKLKESFERSEYENIFLSGGIAHLIGPFNLLDMLEEEGFTVKQLSCSERE